MNITKEYLDNNRHIGDPEADKVVRGLIKSNSSLLYGVINLPAEKLRNNVTGNKSLDSFIHHNFEIPEWLNTDLLEKASLFYRTYAQQIMMLLGAVSLPYCYAAYPGNKVLYLSEKMTKNPGKRLLDTASFVIAISEPRAFIPGGPGYLIIQKTRLIHAIVRFHLKNHTDWNKSYGLPANMEDMAGTNLAFCYKPVSSLWKIGINIKDEDLNAYLHLWKWTGYLMGIPLDLLPNNTEEAKLLELTIRQRNFRSSIEARKLSQSLIDHYNEALPMGLGKLVESQIILFLEKDVVSILGLQSSAIRDITVKTITGIQKLKNRILPVKPSYNKMKREHKRLSKMFS